MTVFSGWWQWWQWWLSLWETCTQFAKCKNHHIWISKSTSKIGENHQITMTFYMTKSSVNQVFLAMFNSYFDITRGSNPWGPIEDERLCRSCFFCHSWAPEPRERRGLATEKKPGGSKEVRYDEALVFSTSKISKPKASKNRKKPENFDIDSWVFTWVFQIFMEIFIDLHGFHTLETGWFLALSQANTCGPGLVVFYTPGVWLSRSDPGEIHGEFPWWETFWWCQQFANLKPWGYFPSRNFVSFPS